MIKLTVLGLQNDRQGWIYRGGVQGVRTPALLLGVPFFENNKFSKRCLFPLRIASEVVDFDW